MVPPKSVLVTGCSEGGIGYAICEELLARGHRVYAGVRRREAARGLEAAGATLLTLDVTSSDSIAAAAKLVRASTWLNRALDAAGPPALDLSSHRRPNVAAAGPHAKR